MPRLFLQNSSPFKQLVAFCYYFKNEAFPSFILVLLEMRQLWCLIEMHTARVGSLRYSVIAV